MSSKLDRFSLKHLRDKKPPERNEATSSQIVRIVKKSGSFDDDDSEDLDEESASKTPFYITVETQEGQLEHVPVEMDASNFSANKPILTYLADVGEISPPNFENDSTNPLSIVSNEELENELQKRARESRSNSIVTPNLIESLKSNKRRLVSKNGQCNVELKKVPKKNVKLMKDIFTTAVDMRWRYTLLSFATSFFISWLIFAVIWWLIAYGHGDLEEQNLPDGAAQSNGSFVPCVWAIQDFTSCFLFSIETQHTIGYGSRSTSEQCPLAIIVMCMQSIIGVVISACMAGIVFAKLARPKLRSNTILFSKNAVITKRNGDLYLLFRVGNMRKSHLIEAHLRAQIVHHNSVTLEGEALHYDHEELSVCCQTIWDDEDRALIIWPITIAHKIDDESPFYSMSPKDILASKFEIIVSLEGVVEPTGNSVQAMSSYLPNEILWGYHFDNMISYSRKRGVYVVDCSNLNALIQDETPRLSAKEMKEQKPNKNDSKCEPSTAIKFSEYGNHLKP